MAKESRINLIDRLSQKLEQDEENAAAEDSLAERAVQNYSSDQPQENEFAEAPPPVKSRTLEPPAISSAAWHSSEAQNSIELDLEMMAKAGFLVTEGERSKLKEQYRVIKRPLLVNAFQRPEGTANPHIIMVTSARPNEGKTFTATNLAMSIAAEREVKVLLMDGDVIRQDLTRQFGLDDELGYLDLLKGRMDSVSDIITRTNIPSLAILPCGSQYEEATELFSSTRMTDLMDDLADRYSDRIIIIDTPPLLATSETQALAFHAGQSILVVEAGETTHRQLDEALTLLPSRERLYCILNKANESDIGDKYANYESYYR